MLDLVRENPKLVKESLKKRGMDPKILDSVTQLDESWRKLKGDADTLRARRNKISQEINQLKKEGKDASKAIKEAASVPAKIKDIEEKMKSLEGKMHEVMCALPNVLHESVPAGKDSTQNKVIKEFGKKNGIKNPKNHVELLELNDLADFDKAAKLAGSRWYFLKGDLAVLSIALTHYGIDFLRERGYTLMIPPYFMNRKSYDGVAPLADFETVMYKAEGEDLYAIATSEHPLTASKQNTVTLDGDLPLKYAGYSTCFRKEAGAHGVDQKGIFRIHQFDKVEQVAFTTPEQSWKVHEELLKNAVDFWKTLEIPFRQVLLCAGDTGLVMSKTYDLEAWFPAGKEYREVVSCSNATTWQSSRLGIKCEAQPGVNRRLAHTLNSTLVAVQRALAAILENNQQEDGTIAVPKVLQKYTGFKVIGKKKK